MDTGRRIAATSMLVSGLLAVIKIFIGLHGNSTAVVADGMESAGDVFASGVVFFGLWLASKPADENHPYGHGRVEILSGLLIGLVLTAAGVLICYGSIERIGKPHEALATYVFWPLVLSMVAKTSLATFKFRYGRKIQSASLTADAWNDAMDTLSATVALIAVGLALYDPAGFHEADRYGGAIVGLIVVLVGVRVSRDTGMQLMDTMPDDDHMRQIREVAETVPGVAGVEKCYARKTGLRYHVDLHMEVDPNMTVRKSHELAHDVRLRILERLNWVADVLVHVEPAP